MLCQFGNVYCAYQSPYNFNNMYRKTSNKRPWVFASLTDVRAFSPFSSFLRNKNRTIFGWDIEKNMTKSHYGGLGCGGCLLEGGVYWVFWGMSKVTVKNFRTHLFSTFWAHGRLQRFQIPDGFEELLMSRVVHLWSFGITRDHVDYWIELKIFYYRFT